ncbi:hypothetical protein [Sulfitobacter sp.]|jgi:hypothetical protein|uniref:hypothetical protein n=1 Tax=Sulfitobacter sp. TaxID=1903071 RepID=UPI0039E615C5
MALTNLIDLIAEVAAKRTAREGKTEAETPKQVSIGSHPNLAFLGRLLDFIKMVSCDRQISQANLP